MTLRHTASFLQTFHTAQTQAQRTANSQTATPTDRMDTDPAAVAFARGARSAAPTSEARPTAGRLIEIEGHKVRVDGGFVTEKQAKWIINIATTRVIPNGATAESVLVRLEQGFAKYAGSQFITTYKDLPRITAAMTEAIFAPGASTKAHEEFKSNTMPEVAAGRYAIVTEGVTKFYRVTKGKDNGRWAGKTFVEAQASDDHYPVRGFAARNEVLRAISANPLEAERRYGQELGKCSRCGRTLTDETSRAYGIGPECRKK